VLLKELKSWMADRGYPFGFVTEASIDLAEDIELMEMMLECNFGTVFLGIETPDEGSLEQTRKFQNTRSPLVEAVQRITQTGLRVMSGFIIGFDHEKPGAGDRIVQFVEQTTIPTAFFSMLQALPDTALWHRLEKEGRLRNSQNVNGNQTNLMNFIPTRPLEEITREYIDAFWTLYDSDVYLDRIYRHIMLMGLPKVKSTAQPITFDQLRAGLTLIWRQGVIRSTRWKFWHHLLKVMQHKPALLTKFLITCAYGEHFLSYRQVVRDQLEQQLAEFLAEEEHFQLEANQSVQPLAS
jgi:radical SAM superfamily enzyme YgiQ (UPF0313 family)